jgi:hypothetical protein
MKAKEPSHLQESAAAVDNRKKRRESKRRRVNRRGGKKTVDVNQSQKKHKSRQAHTSREKEAADPATTSADKSV